MAYESFSDRPDVSDAPVEWRLDEYGVPTDDLDALSSGFQAMGASESDDGQTLVDPDDPIEALIAEAKAEFARPPESRRSQPEIPRQPVRSRDEADHMHHLMQEAEYHPLFNKLPRAQIVQMMLDKEAEQRAAALATPDQEYTPSYESDRRRVAERMERKLGKKE